VNVTREVLIPIRDGRGVYQVNTCYRAAHGLGLFQLYSEMEGSDTFGAVYHRLSDDNGRTWSEPALDFRPHDVQEGWLQGVSPGGIRGVHRWGESALFLDEDNGAVLHFFNDDIYPQGSYSGDVRKYTRILIRTSRDGGQSFDDGTQLVQKGFDPVRWAAGVERGRNSIATSFCAPIKTATGAILFPVQRCPLDSDFAQSFLIQWQAGCFVGRWSGDTLEWDLGEFVCIDPAVSSRGLTEPTVAELGDGALLMVCRGSNHTIPDVPGRKWCATSTDGGLTWSEPAPLAYADGTPFFSPATGSRLIRHSVSGKLYWIGNIVPENPDGNRPRYPLQIAEVDEAKRALTADTVRVIEDRREGDSPAVQFSNFRVYEDRKTHEFVLVMARFQERGDQELASPAYEYRIQVEG
jgi:hypothetical protein